MRVSIQFGFAIAAVITILAPSPRVYAVEITSKKFDFDKSVVSVSDIREATLKTEIKADKVQRSPAVLEQKQVGDAR